MKRVDAIVCRMVGYRMISEDMERVGFSRDGTNRPGAGSDGGGSASTDRAHIGWSGSEWSDIVPFRPMRTDMLALGMG